MAIDLTTDYKLVDNVQTVTYTPPGGAADSVPYAHFQAMRISDGAGGWYMSSTEGIWFLPGAQMANTPDEGGRVVSASLGNWTVIDAGRDPDTNVWECRAVKERT